MTVLKFGIQEKTALLVMIMAVVSALAVAMILQGISAQMIEKHELVDLGDEAELRAWEIVDQFSALREDLDRLASDEKIQDLIYGDPDGGRVELTDLCSKLCQQWPSYLLLELVDASRPNEAIPLIRDVRLDEEPRNRLVQRGEEAGGRSSIFISPVQRIQAEVSVPTETVWPKKWLPLVWGVARINQPPMHDGPVRYIAVAMELETTTSPRHLMFVVDSNEKGGNQPFIVHPNMSIQGGFGESDMFQVNLREEFESATANLENEKKQAAENGLLEFERVERLAQLENIPLQETNHFYFLEGKPTEAFQQKLTELQKQQPTAYRLALDAIESKYDSMARRLGGMGDRVREVRLLARDPAEFKRSSSSETPTFLQAVETELRDFAQMKGNERLFHWNDVVRCENCHVSFVDFYLETSEGRKKYLMMYAAFHEEFIGAIRHEIRSGLFGWVIVLGIGSLALAFVAALLFIKPLRQMTETAQHVVAEKGQLHEKLAELAANLPTERKDEVGDIARASQRLFDEVVTSHEQLEGRVKERTRELEEANTQLESLGKEKDAFLANVSHELRTPLTAVSGFLQLLKRKKLDEKGANYVGKALAGASNLEALIDDILDFQKIIMGGLTLHDGEFEVQQLLTDLEESMQFHVKKNSNRFEIECDENLGKITTDRQRLRQVLSNLITNSSKFTKDGVIRISAESFDKEGKPWARIRIADSGRGMSEAEQKKLFVRFNTSRTANEGGTGLGLVICEGLCKLMGGRLFLEHSAPGEGSTFVAEIPQTLFESTQES
ncbi:MAG: signal transduction histidine kinase [Verrucomicrobiales bacterium]|jgi:signal transduction histidine kinase